MWLHRDGTESRRAGFALIEVLVAVAVAGLIMAALMRAFTNVWDTTRAVRENAEAMWLAQTVLAGVSRATLAEGEREGADGRYRWSMTVTAPALPALRQQQQPQQQVAGEQPQTPAGKLYRIEIAVVAPSGRRTSLETYRLAQAAR